MHGEQALPSQGVSLPDWGLDSCPGVKSVVVLAYWEVGRLVLKVVLVRKIMVGAQDTEWISWVRLLMRSLTGLGCQSCRCSSLRCITLNFTFSLYSVLDFFFLTVKKACYWLKFGKTKTQIWDWCSKQCRALFLARLCLYHCLLLRLYVSWFFTVNLLSTAWPCHSVSVTLLTLPVPDKLICWSVRFKISLTWIFRTRARCS